jgi:drug/metabolite transporter (DMT)-like permease
MLGLALAVAASAAWGSADFLGGRTASGLSPLRVAVWSKVAGGTMVALLCLLIGTLPTAAQAPWAAAAGLVGAGALLALYHALSLGPMSLVAPLSACGAVVPVVVALARGELPGPVTSAGSRAPSPARSSSRARPGTGKPRGDCAATPWPSR